jgi:nitrogen fixation/metabolism regulation signal transduction histidine kinase
LQESSSVIKNLSMTTKLVLIMVLTIGFIVLGALYAANHLFLQLNELNHDEKTEEALIKAQALIIQYRNHRSRQFEQALLACIERQALEDCKVNDIPIVIKKLIDSPPATESYWASEKRYIFSLNATAYQAEITWAELKPDFESIRSLVESRSHLREIRPKIALGSIWVFSFLVLLVTIIGCALAYFFAQSLRQRVNKLVHYAKEIGAGKLNPAPAMTTGSDEVGVLAQTMSTMVVDLHKTQQKLIYAEKLNSWQNIARKIAHEIKNPLTPMSLIADQMERCVLQNKDLEANRLKEISLILKEEIAALNRMVSEFSSFARLPQPQFKVEVVASVLEDFYDRNKDQQNLEIELKNDPASLEVRVDKRMIFQILHNLVNNSRRACDPKPAHMTISSTSEGRWAVIRVADNGPGVPEEIREHIFDAYVTSRSTGEKERGMGLGLAISRKIAEDHGGELGLESSIAGKGTVFKLCLPLAKEE